MASILDMHRAPLNPHPVTMEAYIDEMIASGEVTWEWLAENGYVDPASIDGLTDAKWLPGDDLIADANQAILDIADADSISATMDGIEVVFDAI